MIKHLSGIALAIITAFVLSSCFALPRQTTFVNGAKRGPVRDPASVAMRVDPCMTPNARKVAVFDSRRSEKFTADDVAGMLNDLRSEAARAGVDAVTNIRILHDWRRGFIRNPRTPFPSVMQGSQNLYFLRGDGIRYCNGCVPAGRAPSVAYFINQPLPKGPFKGSSSNENNFGSMIPGKNIEAGTASYIDAISGQ